MKKMLSLLALGLAMSFGAAHAADEKAPSAQQSKMKTCNADAKTKDLKGDERKAFMKSCLSNKPAAPEGEAKTAQQSKMKTCNVEAKTKDLKGEERKQHMKECLSAK
jgi:ribosomal protein S3AE